MRRERANLLVSSTPSPSVAIRQTYLELALLFDEALIVRALNGLSIDMSFDFAEPPRMYKVQLLRQPGPHGGRGHLPHPLGVAALFENQLAAIKNFRIPRLSLPRAR